MTDTPRLFGKLTLFVLLSCADFVLTWVLLQRTQGQVGEGNPVARWLLDEYGWPGLAAFKGLTVLLAGGLCLLIARRRPRAAARVLRFACFVLGGVLLYSGYLLGDHGVLAGATSWGESSTEVLPPPPELLHSRQYRVLMRHLSQRLVQGRCSLAEAVELLAKSEKAKDSLWLRELQRAFPGRSVRECLAAHALRHVVVAGLTARPAESLRVLGRLEDEYRATFDARPPFDPKAAWEIRTRDG